MRTVASILVCACFWTATALAEHGRKDATLAAAFEGAAPSEEAETAETPARDDDDLHDSSASEPRETEPDHATELMPGECAAAEVTLRRNGEEPVRLRLTDCHGDARLEALSTLSMLARPKDDADTPSQKARGAVRQLNPELLSRLQRIADRFPDHAIEIVSGYRPKARPSSRHRSADALDIRIEGIDNESLSEFARTLPATGVGYYPNSTFVHIDVRAQAYSWVDTSAPGEAPSYARKPAPSGDGDTHESIAPRAAENTPATAAHVDAAPATHADAAASELDPELWGLAERALVVMNLALGRTGALGSTLPSRQTL